MVRPYLSISVSIYVIILPKTWSDVNCLAFFPNACRFRGNLLQQGGAFFECYLQAKLLWCRHRKLK